jgi:hypothetical protein
VDELDATATPSPSDVATPAPGTDPALGAPTVTITGTPTPTPTPVAPEPTATVTAQPVGTTDLDHIGQQLDTLTATVLLGCVLLAVAVGLFVTGRMRR